ncbi:hypothetical protein LCGC14_2469870, partial [marine sediment metagenome]
MSFPSGGLGTAAEGRQFDSYAAAAIGVEGSALIKIGEGFALPDGRVYVFGKNGPSTVGVANKTAQSAVPSADFDTMAIETAIVAGDKSFTFTNGGTSIVAGDADQGFAIMESAGALGQIVKVHHIRGVDNDGAVANATTGTVHLYPGVTMIAAATTSHKVTLLFNPFFETVIAASPVTAQVVGVPQIALAVGAYGWYQTKGVGSCLVEGTTKIGGVLCPSDGTDGALEEPDVL